MYPFPVGKPSHRPTPASLFGGICAHKDSERYLEDIHKSTPDTPFEVYTFAYMIDTRWVTARAGFTVLFENTKVDLIITNLFYGYKPKLGRTRYSSRISGIETTMAMNSKTYFYIDALVLMQISRLNWGRSYH